MVAIFRKHGGKQIKLQSKIWLIAFLVIILLTNCKGGSTGCIFSPKLVSIAIMPTDATITLGITADSKLVADTFENNPRISMSTKQFKATGSYSGDVVKLTKIEEMAFKSGDWSIKIDKTKQDITKLVTWDSSNPEVATISNEEGTKGLVTAVAHGTTTITATWDRISGSTTLIVTNEVALLKDGRTICYDNSGAIITCPGPKVIDIEALWPSPRFTIDGLKRCVTDNSTGLMWMIGDSGTSMTWDNAIAYADGLDFCGYTDWRLPTLTELKSIVNSERVERNKGDSRFVRHSNNQRNTYWSSTPEPFFGSNIMLFSFYDGKESFTSKSQNYYVKVVRSVGHDK